MTTSSGSNPLSVRLNPEQRTGLETIGARNPSAALQEGLERMIRLRTPKHQPLYAQMVDDPEVVAVIDGAVSAACDALSELFPKGRGVELRGISSNFQGLLMEHITAMLTGTEAADRRWKTELNALLATEYSFGRLPYEKDEPRLGYTVVKLAQRIEQDDLFLDPDRGYCELAKLGAGGLFTSTEACVRGVIDRMKRREELPREENVRLCSIVITDQGPLRVHAIASVGGDSAITAEEYAARSAKWRERRKGWSGEVA